MEAEATTQDNCRQLVDNHVYCNVSHLVDELRRDEKYMDELLEVQVQFVHQDDGEEVINEALEHWVVSDYLAERLKKAGEMVMDFYNLPIWGRTTSGQAISIDSVIVDIYNKSWA